MGHYAKIDKDSIVTDVIVAKADYINSLPDKDSWIKTSYNTADGIHYTPKKNQDFLDKDADQSKALRYRFAGIGMKYDKDNDVFYLQQPFPSWVLDKTDWAWKAPVTAPTLTDEDKQYGRSYYWDEDKYQADNTKGWVLEEIGYQMTLEEEEKLTKLFEGWDSSKPIPEKPDWLDEKFNYDKTAKDKQKE